MPTSTTSADAPARQVGPDGEVTLWQIDLSAVSDRSVAVRAILARRLGTDPRALAFDRTCRHCGGPHGKPRLAGEHRGTLEFSVSSTGALALVAVSRDRVVGVDVERLRPVRQAARRAAQFFAATEAAVIADTEPSGQSEQLLRQWTKKESFLKGCGLGIARGMAWFAVEHDDDPCARLRVAGGSQSAGTTWWIDDVPVAPGHVAALSMAMPRIGSAP